MKKKTEQTNPASIQIERNTQATLIITQGDKTGYAHSVMVKSVEVKTSESQDEQFPFEITMKFCPII